MPIPENDRFPEDRNGSRDANDQPELTREDLLERGAPGNIIDDSTTIPGVGVTPLKFNELGDIVSKVGYVMKYVIDVPKYRPPEYKNIAQIHVDKETFLTVIISSTNDPASGLWEGRLLHKDDRQGEDLAVTMGVVATLKDAFIHRKKVKIWATLCQEERYDPNDPSWDPENRRKVYSDIYRAIRSVEIFAA